MKLLGVPGQRRVRVRLPGVTLMLPISPRDD